jgi:hypothetical protein
LAFSWDLPAEICLKSTTALICQHTLLGLNACIGQGFVPESKDAYSGYSPSKFAGKIRHVFAT